MKASLLPPEIRPPVRLAAVQHAMARAIMQPLGPRQRMRRTQAPIAAAIVKPNDRLSSVARLQIYNQQYWWRLQGALADDFPGLRAVLGARRFDRLANAYLDSRGSTSWNLRDLGQHLEGFLRECPSVAGPCAELACEVAQVEWARTVAFDGVEKPRLDPQALAGVRPGSLRIGLQPYLTLLELTYPVDRVLGRVKLGIERVRRVRSLPRPIYLAVHRQDFSVYYKRLEAEEFDLLRLLRDGASLETACGKAVERARDTSARIGERIQAWFASWMRFGWLCEP